MATSTLPMIISNPDRTAVPDDGGTGPFAPRVARAAGLAVLLIGTAVLYLWTLSESGWANSY